MQEVIPILISKDDGCGNFVKAEQAQIEKVGQEVANTLTCHEPGFSVHHCNMCIVAMRGRNPENPSDRTPGIHTEQRLEPNSEGICNTLTTRPEGKKTAILPVVEKYRIRKLTPKECWRLMGFTDEDFEKAASVNSNSQLYKQAGNSIVKNVLMAIFNKMVVTA